MEADPSVIEVYCEGEKILPLTTVPTFEGMLQRLEDLLSTPRDAFAVFYEDAAGESHQITSEELFQEAFSEADLPFLIRVEQLQQEGPTLCCLYCEEPLDGRSDLCQKCGTVSWDSWFMEKHGEERFRELMEPKGREAKGFSFGPVDILQEPKASPGGAKRSPDAKSEPVFVEDDDDLNQRGSLEELQRDSFGEANQFQTPPRKPKQPDSQSRFVMSDDIVDLETPAPQSDSKPADKDLLSTPPAKVPEAILSESPPITQKEQEPRLTKSYHPGLQPSPYLSPEKGGLHDRSTCAICQRSQRNSSILSRESAYKDSLFRYSHVTGESSYTRDTARKSSPLRDSRYLSEQSPFASRLSPFARRSYYNPVNSSYSYTKPLRDSSPFKQSRNEGNAWQCRNCLCSPPWYFSHCQKCELTQSLSQQPFDSYKRRVELMCRR